VQSHPLSRRCIANRMPTLPHGNDLVSICFKYSF